MLGSLLLIDTLPLVQQRGQVFVLVLLHPYHPVPVGHITRPLKLILFNPLFLLLLPEQLRVLLEFVELEFEQGQLLHTFGSLNVILLLLLCLQTNLELLLLFLEFFHLFRHDVIGIHLGDCILVQLSQNLLTDVCLGQLLDLVLVVLGLDGFELLLLPLFIPEFPFHGKPLGFFHFLLGELLLLLLDSILHLGVVDILQPFLPFLDDLVPGQQPLMVPNLALVICLRDLRPQLCGL